MGIWRFWGFRDWGVGAYLVYVPKIVFCVGAYLVYVPWMDAVGYGFGALTSNAPTASAMRAIGAG
ncbi:MAG: hypothetical protein K6F33_06975 [Bacteroidales bacterium]|nr:hypothetical protein [Bacteroidales bacterium]